MGTYYKNCYKEAIEKQWRYDLKNWLRNCKNKEIITEEVLADWDKKLNDISNMSDIKSFCTYSGWEFGEPPFDIDLFVKNIPLANCNDYEDYVSKIIFFRTL